MTSSLHVRCCIAGGGPAGMMLGLLLARAGIDVAVLERHGDFLRDFRGDTVHPSTLDIIDELGLLDEFLKLPHQELRQIGARVGEEDVIVSDLTHLPTRCPFVALMPQWDFLNFLAAKGRQHPTFRLRMNTEAIGLLEESGRIVGARARDEAGAVEVRAELTIGADGRHSVIRREAGLAVEELGAPIDVLWMRLSRIDADPPQTFGYFTGGQVLVMLNRGDYWQCGLVIAKGGFDRIRQHGIDAFRERVGAIVPFTRNRLRELKDFDHVKLLSVRVDRLRQWYRAGLLCIGDAAHAMSPVGGVGINLAVQDAVAAANRLAEPLRRGAPSLEDLDAVQRRRMFPTRMTQRLQILVQNRILSSALVKTPRSLPLALWLVRRWPALRRIPARVIGVGFRPEHVLTPDVFRAG